MDSRLLAHIVASMSVSPLHRGAACRPTGTLPEHQEHNAKVEEKRRVKLAARRQRRADG